MKAERSLQTKSNHDQYNQQEKSRAEKIIFANKESDLKFWQNLAIKYEEKKLNFLVRRKIIEPNIV